MFAALEARLNRAAITKLANALAVIPGITDPVPVIFDAEYRPGMVGVVGMGAADPQLVMSSEIVPPDFVGQSIQVNGAGWRVAEEQPDGTSPTGLTVVILEKV